MIIKNILLELLNMFWDIYWALALGFILSAFIRAFVSTTAVTKKLGRNNAKGLALSAIFGAISSSCSYAAASMSRTLIIKGASWNNAIAFLIASTNLVFEIFLVIITLLGWSFFGGEIAGGILFIVIGALLIKWLLTKHSIQQANEHIQKTESEINKNDPHAHHAAMGMEHEHNYTEQHHQHSNANTHKHQSKDKPSSKLTDAAGYFFMDVTMVGKDILLGVIISAILTVVVPIHFWEKLFLKNNTHLPQVIIVLWNAIVGILVAIFAFVCSVGNILLAAVLWHGGINFGGVIAFILSDLVTMPMLMVYRRYYGINTMWRLFIILSLSILITGLVIDFTFQRLGWIPANHGQQMMMQMQGISWNYKTVLNLIFVPLSLYLFFKGKRKMR